MWFDPFVESRKAVQACLNGTRRRDRHHARVPVTPQQIAEDAAACAALGVVAVHVHVREERGLESLADEHVSPVVEAVRAASGVRLGLTTGAWIIPNPALRCATISGWSTPPDFASVNWHEEGAEDVAATLLDRGLGVEAGLWGLNAVSRWTRSPLAGSCERVLLELPDGLTDAEVETSALRMLDAVRSHDPGIPVQLHGEHDTAWAAIALAGTWGLETRIGLEDTLALPDLSLIHISEPTRRTPTS